MTPTIAAENVQRLLKIKYGNHSPTITTIVPTKIAEIDLISIMRKHGGRLVNTSDRLPSVRKVILLFCTAHPYFA